VLETLTFVFAIVGYTGLTYTALAAAWVRVPWALWRATSLVILAHVLMVWAVRYGWSFAEATEHGWFGFLLFHGAFLVTTASHAVPERIARRLVWGGYAVVTFGALGAVQRYPVVAVYRVPVGLLAFFGTAGLLIAWATRRRREATALAT